MINVEVSATGIDDQMDEQYRKLASLSPLSPVTFVIYYDNKFSKMIAKVMRLKTKKTLSYKEYVFLRKGNFL